MSKNSTYHERIKHINVRLHFVREIINNGEVHVMKVSNDDNVGDMITKILSSCKFSHCMQLIGLNDDN